jgi:ornithine carbamoyltransferase
VVYTDAWTSMGQEAETETRRDAFAGFGVDARLNRLHVQKALLVELLGRAGERR